MRIKAKTPDDYVAQLPEDRRDVINRMRNTLVGNLPSGFEEQMSYGMIGYVVPKKVYPKGYHVNPQLPLPFIHLASQKNHIGFYHMALYSDDKLLNWFTTEYAKFSKRKLDMGKSCVRFKKPDHIPFDLIAKLAKKISPQEWISMYEGIIKP
ncbi:MAG TPA: hypothetical protein DDX92_02955 [Flavobacteriales bacterium]|jgi:hypothetical protein|nr:hypothetical protein [Flavobacteriales bacterium]